MNISFENTANAFAYKSDKDLKKARFLFKTMSYEWIVKLGIKLSPWLLKNNFPFFKPLVRTTIFHQFVGGETLEKSTPIANKLASHNVQVILDYGVEGKEGEDNFNAATEEFIKVVQYAATQQNIPFISIKITGLARFGLLESLNEAPRLRSGVHDNENEIEEWNRVRERMYKICAHAAKLNVGVLIDAEETWIQDPIDKLVTELMEEFNKEKAIVYNTFQLYRHDRFHFLKLSHNIAQERKFILGAKLVRGAYMEKERERATLNGYDSPIHLNKENCDKDFNDSTKYCIDNLDSISVIIASHNELSNLFGLKLLEEKGLPLNHHHVHFSQLYGMSDNITFNLAIVGCNVSKYLPFGPINDVIPYLMRRAEENSSISGQTSKELSLIEKEIKRRKR
jgi:proline dehydrogenase